MLFFQQYRRYEYVDDAGSITRIGDAWSTQVWPRTIPLPCARPGIPVYSTLLSCQGFEGSGGFAVKVVRPMLATTRRGRRLRTVNSLGQLKKTLLATLGHPVFNALASYGKGEPEKKYSVQFQRDDRHIGHWSNHFRALLHEDLPVPAQ